ncbi:MAG: alpha-mannosidase [Armatimonadota bacterium]
MSFTEDLDRGLQALGTATSGVNEPLERFRAEVEFAGRLAQAQGNAEWEGLIQQAIQSVTTALAQGTPAEKAVADAESMLAPVGKAAKAYTIHCTGHAHIDMNWMWNWPETVATTNDTFTTVDRLMDEFPTFKFSQSQASVYQIMKDYLPELYARVKQRVAEGRWEITASHWVEGDKNMASGEILCRHMLYTRRFLKQEFGFPYDAVTIDWQPDTFGHPQSIPTILTKGGVKRYYFHRGREKEELFWWQGTDGSRVLAFDDWRRGYNGVINAGITNRLFDFEQQTGLKDYLFVFGVGDHGGGPTRQDLKMAVKLNAWPIFPNVKLSTYDEFYSIAEQAKDLPVCADEMNFILEGCYTAESNIKLANRKSENALVEAEMAALLGKHLAGMAYPTDALYTGWKHAMFNQFHDILPGSGVHATYEHAQGLFQEIMAQTTMIKTRALRTLASLVNTLASCPCEEFDTSEPGANIGPGIGAGPGDVPAHGVISRRGPGSACCDPFVIFNPSPWPRNEVVTARIWDRPWQHSQIAVIDDEGNKMPAQIVSSSNNNWGWWGHQYVDVAFPVKDVAGLGYRSYSVARAVEPGTADTGCSGDGAGRMENEFYKVEVEQASGAIVHLIDKKTRIDLVPAGGKLGLLEYMLETPHGMTAWVFGQVVKHIPFTDGGILECPQKGPYQAVVRTKHTLNDSTFTLTITLAAGVPRIDFSLDVNWLERGDGNIGVPSLKVAFPLAISNGTVTAETPNSFVTRSTNPEDLKSFTFRTLAGYTGSTPPVPLHSVDAPMQKWVDLTGAHAGTGEPVGATVVNDSKYGYSVDDNLLRIDLLRSSYDPDPLPEMGQHTINFAIQPHVGAWTVSDSTRAGYAFNLPLNVVATSQQEGSLPVRAGYLEVLTPNVMLSGMKKAEDSDALIIRLYEMEGKPVTAQVRLANTLAPANAPAVETDVLEQQLPHSTARMDGDVLNVDIPAFGLVTVKVG